ncbi:hypothetical protein [Rhodococcus qingshengii]|uniref:hypothetical protein n=1 Tax=Rhodococcus qingshengii TaxID=334542 RepID=UPI00287F9EC9|nr:hypothetical protein [Rhodococcus qingshengii]
MSEIRSQATPATNLETQLRDALQTAARTEILRNPNSATQFKTQTKTNQDRIIQAYSAWVLPTILPIIKEHAGDN